jgi:O-antigen biosynthesis protein
VALRRRSATNTECSFKALTAKLFCIFNPALKQLIDKIAPGGNKWKAMLGFASFVFSRQGIKVVAHSLRRKAARKSKPVDYDQWIRMRESAACNDALRHQPCETNFLIYIPYTAASSVHLLDATIRSIKAQPYTNWHIVIAYTDPASKDSISGYADDGRISILHSPDPACIAALRSMVAGWTITLPPGYLLACDHLNILATRIKKQPDSELIYWDDDSISEHGRYHDPIFKTGYSRHLLFTHNYIGETCCFSGPLLTSIFDSVDGDMPHNIYELLLFGTTLIRQAAHISQVLIHKLVEVSENNGVSIPADDTRSAIERFLGRQHISADVVPVSTVPGAYRIACKLLDTPKVSIIIPSRDNSSMLKRTLDAVLRRTSYPDLEVIIVNNNSSSPDFFDLIEQYTGSHPGIVSCIDVNTPFNFPKLINAAAAHASGRYLLLLNNDMDVIDPGWLAEMVAYAQGTQVGAVGVKLLYPDDTIQHAGIALQGPTASMHVDAHLPGNAIGYMGRLQLAGNCSAVTGACLLCSKEVFVRAGGMDEELVVEYNDIDLCLSIAGMGFDTACLPYISLYHYESATRGHPYRSRRSWIQHEHDLTIFKRKWGTLIGNDPFFNPNSDINFTNLIVPA